MSKIATETRLGQHVLRNESGKSNRPRGTEKRGQVKNELDKGKSIITKFQRANEVCAASRYTNRAHCSRTTDAFA